MSSRRRRRQASSKARPPLPSARKVAERGLQEGGGAARRGAVRRSTERVVVSRRPSRRRCRPPSLRSSEMSAPHVVKLLGLGLLAVAAAADSIWFPSIGHAHAKARPDRRASDSGPGSDVTRMFRSETAATATAVAAATAPPVPLGGIPVEILRQLSDIENATYFLNNFVDTESLTALSPTDIGHELENRFGAVDERKSILTAKAALCQPQLELVSLMVTTDPSMYYYPTCTRIERCGGCCGSHLMTCQAVESEIVNMKVIVTQYVGKPQMIYKGHEIVPLERHTKCKCDCIKKETDCNKLQEFHKNDCECICINVDEQQKCQLQSHNKQWDPSTCTCNCRESRDCNSSSYYDLDSCSCIQTSSSRNRRKDVYFYEPTL